MATFSTSSNTVRLDVYKRQTLDHAQQLPIEVVPFYVSLDGEHYRKEGKEIAVRDFYQFMVANPSAYPKTSLASIEDFEQAFRAHAAAGREVLDVYKRQVVASASIFGMRALLVTAVSVVACVAFEWLYCKLLKRCLLYTSQG